MQYNDKDTWKLFAEGKTKGVFQLESNLGKSWAKKLAPNSIEELSALIAIIRPGTLKAYVDGKSMTQHFVDRKHGKEEVVYLHPALEEILKPTYGVLVYQEQSMRIAQKIAGFNLQEADELRKAIGKKKADLMAKVKKKFISGAKKVGTVSKEDAEAIFGWIEKSSRYAFNKSHSISYAVCSYLSAFQKAHNTKEFFLSYLYYANEKQDPHQEIYELISEAKLFDITVKTPSIVNYADKFNIQKNTIYFGLKDIKSLTGKNGDALIEVLSSIQKDLGKTIKDLSWLQVLVYLNSRISSSSFKALASIGFFRGIKDKVTRNKCLYDYEILRSLTKSEQTWLETNLATKGWASLQDALKDLAPTKKEGGGTSRADRKQAILNEIQLLSNPPYELVDDPSWVIDQEVKFLGCPVSLTKVETSDTSAANTTCKDVVNGKKGKDLCIVANIQRVSDYKIKKGESKDKIMSFLTIEDETAILDSVIVFPKVKEKYKYILYEGNNLIFCGYVNNNDSSFIIEQIHET
jgi:DNA polymerase III alpha subunit